MPIPNKNERRKDFVGRCIPIVMKEGTAKNSRQGVAICFSIYREHLKKMRSKGELSKEEELELQEIEKEEFQKEEKLGEILNKI